MNVPSTKSLEIATKQGRSQAAFDRSRLTRVARGAGNQTASRAPASIATVRCPGLLGPPPSQIPQSARREDQGEAPQSAERPECPNEEKAAGGFGDLAVMCPPHVHD